MARIEESDDRRSISQPIAPGALLTEVVHEWASRFQQEGATVFVDVADDAPVFDADKALLKRVFANLIQNALTHSAQRESRSSCSATRATATAFCSPWPTTAPAFRRNTTR